MELFGRNSSKPPSNASRATPSTRLTPPSFSDDMDLGVYSRDGPEAGPVDSMSQHARIEPHGDDEKEEFLSEKEYGSDDDSESDAAEDDWTIEEEKAIIRKFDRRLVLFMALLYLLSFLDRSNIGNARVAGLESDLQLTSNQYDWLLTAFYITYIVFEWMTLMYKLVPPHIYIACCVFSWGVLASAQSMASSFTSMLVIRALLGISEAAFGPGVPFYLSFFYKRSELAFRVGLFIAAAPLATSFASTLAWCIVKICQNGPFAPWRALFLVEGFPSILVAVMAFYWIPDSPAQATYLTSRERRIAALRLRKDTVNTSHSSKPTAAASNRLSLRDIVQTLLDPPSYLTALMFLSCNVSFSSLPVFLPTIIHSMGYTSLRSQILSAPPYLVSFLFVLLISSLSDRFNTRSGLLIPVAILSSMSYATIALAGHFHKALGHDLTLLLRYASVYGAAMGFFASITLIITWTLNNSHTHTGRGTGMAVLNIVGQMGPLVGTRLYPDSDGPYYVSGMAVCACFMLGVAVLAATLRFVLNRRNNSVPSLKRDGYEELEMRDRLMGGRHGGIGGDSGEVEPETPSPFSKSKGGSFTYII